MARDYQRSKVYKWEWSHLQSLLDEEWLRPLDDLQDAQSFLDNVCEREGWGRVIVDEGTAKRGRGSCMGPNWIRVPKRKHKGISWGHGYQPWYLLHELAHCHEWRVSQQMPECWHGPVFVAYYVQLLVKHLNAPQERLISSLKAAKID